MNRFFRGLGSTQLAKPKKRVDLMDTALSLWLNGLIHKEAGRSVGHVTQWLPVTG